METKSCVKPVVVANLSTYCIVDTLNICTCFYKESTMKQLFAIVLAVASLTAFAQPAKTPIAATPAPVASAPAKAEAPKEEMKLAKKKDHSKDKKVDATKSPAKSEKAPATTKPEAKPAK